MYNKQFAVFWYLLSTFGTLYGSIIQSSVSCLSVCEDLHFWWLTKTLASLHGVSITPIFNDSLLFEQWSVNFTCH